MGDFMIKKNTHTFIKEVESLYGNEYTVIEDYIKNCEKILIKHNTCNNEFGVTPNNFLRGRKCPKCYKSEKKTTDVFRNELKIKYGNEFELLSEYINNAAKVTVKHNKCGNEFDIKPTHLLEKSRCAYCSGNFKKNSKNINNELLTTNSNVTIIGEIIGMNKQVKCKCNLGHEFYSIPSNLIKGHGCSICAGNSKHTMETLENKLKLKLHDDSYKIISISKYEKVKVFHNKCGNIYETSKDSIRAGSGCSKCSASKGEIRIRKILNSMNIEYIEQYKFEKCINIRSLPFDFYIPKLNTCIEYDGEGHYKPFKYKNALDKLKKTKINDNIKDEFCKNNSIKLIRIPYYDFDKIEDILKATL